MAMLRFSPLAERDLDDLLTYIASDKPEAALRWVQRIKEECHFLANNPEVGAVRPEFRSGEFRNRVVGNYVIFYRPIANGIEVARVARGERDVREL